MFSLSLSLKNCKIKEPVVLYIHTNDSHLFNRLSYTEKRVREQNSSIATHVHQCTAADVDYVISIDKITG